MSFLEGFINVTYWAEELRRSHEEAVAALPIPSLEGLKEAWSQPGVTGALADFIRAVDWHEPFFLYLLCFHVVMYAVVWRLGRTPTGAMVSLCILMLMILSAST
ncbi:MAG: hypothetical protein CUN57_01330, partial [Phototrophicales bacterium]